MTKQIDQEEGTVRIEGGETALEGLPEAVRELPVPPNIGLATIALNFALKYHDTTIVKDGALYQQYKLEGKNMRDLHLDEVFWTASQIEKHLLDTPSRLALMVLETVAKDIDEALEDGPHPESESPAPEEGDAQDA